MEINNLKSNTMKISLEKLIDMFNLSDTIKSLHEELKKAKEKLEQAKEERKKGALRKVARAKKALKEELKKHPLPLPVEEWMRWALRRSFLKKQPRSGTETYTA